MRIPLRNVISYANGRVISFPIQTIDRKFAVGLCFFDPKLSLTDLSRFQSAPFSFETKSNLLDSGALFYRNAASEVFPWHRFLELFLSSSFPFPVQKFMSLSCQYRSAAVTDAEGSFLIVLFFTDHFQRTEMPFKISSDGKIILNNLIPGDETSLPTDLSFPISATSLLSLPLFFSPYKIVSNIPEYLAAVYYLDIYRLRSSLLLTIHNLKSLLLSPLSKENRDTYFYMVEKRLKFQFERATALSREMNRALKSKKNSFGNFSLLKEEYDSIMVQINADRSDFLFNAAESSKLKLAETTKRDEIVFYRGVTTTFFPEVPKVMRTQASLNDESDHYRELKMAFPEEFRGKTLIETLTQMQHFDLPTRLLDTTLNPLVALFMACTDEYSAPEFSNLPGEIIAYFPRFDFSQNQVKYSDSRRVLMLSSLPLLDSEEQKSLFAFLNFCKQAHIPASKVLSFLLRSHGNTKVPKKNIFSKLSIRLRSEGIDAFAKLMEIIKSERPSFDFSRMNPFDLLLAYYVKVGLINPRIAAQAGCFILCGLNPDAIGQSLLSTRQNEEDCCRIIVTNKKNILAELAQLNISKKTLIPDMDHVADFIAES